MILKTPDNNYEIKRIIKINPSDEKQFERVKFIKELNGYETILKQNDLYLLCNKIEEINYLPVTEENNLIPNITN